MRTHARLGLAAALVAGAALAAPAVAAPSVALKAAPAAGKPDSTGGPRTDKASSSKVQDPQVDTCDDKEQADPAGTSTYAGPQNLWPPNHKYVAGKATWADEDPQDMITLMWTATHNQFVDGEEVQGAGNTDNDITPATTPMEKMSGTGSITQDFLVRAERSGKLKEGRTYTISGTMMTTDSDEDGSSEEMSECKFSFEIVVPHDQGRSTN